MANEKDYRKIAESEILSPEEREEKKEEEQNNGCATSIIGLFVLAIFCYFAFTTGKEMIFLPLGFVGFFIVAILFSGTKFDERIKRHAEILEKIDQEKAEEEKRKNQKELDDYLHAVDEIEVFFESNGYSTSLSAYLLKPRAMNVDIGIPKSDPSSFSMIEFPRKPIDFSKNADINALWKKKIPLRNIEYVGFEGNIIEYGTKEHKYESDERNTILRYIDEETGEHQNLIFNCDSYEKIRKLIPEKTYEKYLADVSAKQFPDENTITEAERQPYDPDADLRQSEEYLEDQFNSEDNDYISDEPSLSTDICPQEGTYLPAGAYIPQSAYLPIEEVPHEIVSNEQEMSCRIENDTQEDARIPRRRRLRELKELYDDGLITQEEYETKRKEILDTI